MASRKEILIKLIKAIEMEKPSKNFTPIVMREIEVETSREVIINPALQSILQVTGPPNLHVDFTGKVMAKLQRPLPLKTVRPLISRNAWVTIAVAFGALVIWLGFRKPALATQGLTSYLLKVGNSITDAISNLDDGSVYVATLIAAGGLVVIDYLLKVKHEASRGI